MSRTMRWSATALVLASLTAGAAQAWPLAQSRPDFAAPQVASRLVAAWDWLVSRFRPVEPKPDPAPATSPEKSSCGADPTGHPVYCN